MTGTSAFGSKADVETALRGTVRRAVMPQAALPAGTLTEPRNAMMSAID
jgi:hypothetical protein